MTISASELATVMMSCSASLTVTRVFEQLCTGYRTNFCLQQGRWEWDLSMPVCLCLVCLSVCLWQLALPLSFSTWTFPPCFPATRTHSRRRECPSLVQEEDSLPNQRIEKLPEVHYISCTHVHTLSNSVHDINVTSCDFTITLYLLMWCHVTLL